MVSKTSQAARPVRRLIPVGLRNVALTDGFWAPRLGVLRTVTLHDAFDKFERDGALANFDRVAAGLTGGHCGYPWFDGLVYETIRAASDFMAATPDPKLAERLDGFVARIAAAQATDPDGYINTFVTLMQPEKRWGAQGSDQLWSHEEYDAGCLVEAGVHHCRATGQTSLLALAVRFANYLCAYMGPPPRHNVVPSHSLPEEALLKLYGLLREQPALAERVGAPADPAPYLELVRFWMESRGNHAGRLSLGEYAQDHRPLAEQPEAVGHAVRGTLLYTGLAALAAELDEPAYQTTSARLWEDVVERKMFVTGGVGPIKEYEGFGYGYYLPNTGYVETCAAVGLAFWASRLNQLWGDGACLDVYERALYNTVLAGVSLEGTHYSYENPLDNRGKLHRWEWHRCPCCPPMLLKLFAEMPGLIWAHDERDLYLNLYVSSRARVELPAGPVELDLETGYPWDGAVRLTLRLEGDRVFGLHLRLPAWCPSCNLRVNGAAMATPPAQEGYLTLQRTWRSGDIVELELALPIQRVISHPYANFTRERVALQRGPIVYCLEGADNPGPRDPILAAEPRLQIERRPDLFGGVVTITGQDAEGRPLTAIPYFAWDNRPALSAEQDWLLVWLRQEDWFCQRSPLDGDDRRDWAHALYRPLPG